MKIKINHKQDPVSPYALGGGTHEEIAVEGVPVPGANNTSNYYYYHYDYCYTVIMQQHTSLHD